MAALLAPAYNAAASALSEPAAAPSVAFSEQPLQVYGDDRWPLRRSISYWNDRAGREVIHYAGSHMDVAAASDPHTVVVSFDALTNTASMTAGTLGRTPLAITIDSRSMFQWDVYAREFGRALPF
jgi:hypothetical protein